MVGTAPSQLESAAGPFRFDRAEMAGALGDLGVLVPIAVALIVKNGLTPTAVLLPAGLLYVVAGLFYRLPVPVQPLKAFGAIAIAHGFGADDIAAGALLMGMLFLVLGVSGLLDWVAKVFPQPIIRGIQLSVGLLFCQLAWKLVSTTPKAFTDHRHSIWWLGGATAAVIAVALLLRRRQITLAFLAIAVLMMAVTFHGALIFGPVRSARPASEPGRVRCRGRRLGAATGAVVVRQLVSGHRGHRPHLFRRRRPAGAAGTVGHHDRCGQSVRRFDQRHAGVPWRRRHDRAPHVRRPQRRCPDHVGELC